MNTPSTSRIRIAPRFLWSALVLVAAIVVAILALGGSREIPEKSSKPVAMAITLATARSVEWPEKLSATGPIEAWQEAIIGAQASGLRLVEVRVNVGDIVGEGDILARFDDRMLRAEETQLLASLEQAEAAASQAEVNGERALKQRQSGAISEQEILASVTGAQMAAAQVSIIRAQIAAKRVQLNYTSVRAPDDGVISARQASAGVVANNGDELFRMILRRRLEWRGELTAAQITQVEVGQQVQLLLPDGQTVEGTVRQQAPSLDPARRLGVVYVDLPTGSAARAGMYAKGAIVLRQSAALVIPAASVVIRDGRSYVFAVAAGGKGSTRVRMVAITSGRREGNEVEVPSGISAGEQVVEKGAGFLDDGDLVAVSPSAVGQVALTR